VVALVCNVTTKFTGARMTLHLRPIQKPERKRCDTRALADARARVRRDLENHKAEKRFDAHLPRHFNDREARRRGDCS
jgi:hypothetical protein